MVATIPQLRSESDCYIGGKTRLIFSSCSLRHYSLRLCRHLPPSVCAVLQGQALVGRLLGLHVHLVFYHFRCGSYASRLRSEYSIH
jgi:hypothetical protein